MTDRQPQPTAECDRCGAAYPMPANGWDLYWCGRCPACRTAVDPKYLNRAARERLGLPPRDRSKPAR